MGRYTQTVVCTAHTEVYVLDNKNIDRLLRRNQRTMAMLRSKVESKLRSRSCTRLGRNIELYSYLLQVCTECGDWALPAVTSRWRPK